VRDVGFYSGDSTEGENSPLYAAMGYVRTSDRSSGLKRTRIPGVSSPAAESEKDKEEAAA